MVSYQYNSWGVPLTTTDATAEKAGTWNSFCYWGYCWDEETGLYYVGSWYYDPETCRWINTDIPSTLIADFENFAQYNLFAYCFNNPANMSDETGNWPGWATKLAIGVGAIAVGAAVVAAIAVGLKARLYRAQLAQ